MLYINLERGLYVGVLTLGLVDSSGVEGEEGSYVGVLTPVVDLLRVCFLTTFLKQWKMLNYSILLKLILRSDNDNRNIVFFCHDMKH